MRKSKAIRLWLHFKILQTSINPSLGLEQKCKQRKTTVQTKNKRRKTLSFINEQIHQRSKQKVGKNKYTRKVLNKIKKH